MTAVELRTYRIASGRAHDLFARFRDHTIPLFGDHGMTAVSFWIGRDDPNILVYLLRHDGDPAANWSGFQADPRWVAVRDESTRGGPLTESVDSVFLEPTALDA